MCPFLQHFREKTRIQIGCCRRQIDGNIVAATHRDEGVMRRKMAGGTPGSRATVRGGSLIARSRISSDGDSFSSDAEPVFGPLPSLDSRFELPAASLDLALLAAVLSTFSPEDGPSIP